MKPEMPPAGHFKNFAKTPPTQDCNWNECLTLMMQLIFNKLNFNAKTQRRKERQKQGATIRGNVFTK
jgi:hypothetical protein